MSHLTRSHVCFLIAVCQCILLFKTQLVWMMALFIISFFLMSDKSSGVHSFTSNTYGQRSSRKRVPAHRRTQRWGQQYKELQYLTLPLALWPCRIACCQSLTDKNCQQDETLRGLSPENCILLSTFRDFHNIFFVNFKGPEFPALYLWKV